MSACVKACAHLRTPKKCEQLSMLLSKGAKGTVLLRRIEQFCVHKLV